MTDQIQSQSQIACPPTPKLSFVVTAWAARRPLALPCLLASLRCQTVPDWEALVLDSEDYLPHRDLCACDGRVSYLSEPLGRKHRYNEMYLASEWGVRQARGKYLAFPSDDSYLVPWFLDRMIDAAERNQWGLTYCDGVLGNSRSHLCHSTSPVRCAIDKSFFIVRRDQFPASWPGQQGDDWGMADGALVEALVAGGVAQGKVEQVLCVHN